MEENKKETNFQEDGSSEELNSSNYENNIGQTINDEEEAPNETKKRKKILPIITGILAGIVVVAFITLLVIYLTSPKNKFFSLVNNAFSDVSKEVNNFEDSVFGQILALDTSSKLSIDIKMNGNVETDNEDIKEWVQNLESFEINAVENVDITNNYSDMSGEIILNGEKFFSGDLIQNKNIISAKIDDITEGYITVENDNLSVFWDKIGYEGPESLTFHTDFLKDLNFTKSDIKALKNALGAFGNGFITVFEDSDFSFGEGTVKYDEGTIECKNMDLFVEPEKFNNGLISGFEKIISDEKYINALYKCSSTLDRISGYLPFTREEFEDNIKMRIEEFKNIEFPEEAEGFRIRLYYKGSDILKVAMLAEDYTQLLEFIVVNNKDSAYYKFYDGMTVYEDKVTTMDDVTIHMVNVDYILPETGEIAEGEGSEISITIDNSKENQQTINLTEKVRLLSYNEDLENLDIMSIEPTTIVNYTLKGSIDGDNNNIELVMIDGDNTFTSTFSVVANIKENVEFENKIINDDENFNTEVVTDEEFSNKKNKVIENWNNTVGSSSEKILQFESVVYTYLSMFIPVPYYEEEMYEDYENIDLEGLEFTE